MTIEEFNNHGFRSRDKAKYKVASELKTNVGHVYNALKKYAIDPTLITKAEAIV